MRAKVEAETRRVASSIGTTNRVNLQKESEIRAAIETQKNRVLELKKQRDELSVLQREVESAQRAYELVSQRLTQTNLESQISQTNVVMLNPADEPIEPASPKILLNLALSIFLGTLLGVGAALLHGNDRPPRALRLRPCRIPRPAAARRARRARRRRAQPLRLARLHETQQARGGMTRRNAAQGATP